MYRSVNPSTGKLVAEFDLHSDGQVAEALELAAAAARSWARSPVGERAQLLGGLAERLEDEADELGRLMATEMGKPLAQGVAEAEKCAWVCRCYADNAAAFLAPRAAESDGSAARIEYRPLGPILAIMPWNFPFWQVFRAAAPALAAGNVMVLKHAPNTPGCAARIEEIFAAAGAPAGLLQNLYLTNEQAARVIEDPAIRGVTLTGSSRAGAAVAATAGGALKPMLAELGGSDPFVVFADADLDAAVETAISSRLLNNGQSCIAAKRFLVQESIRSEFTAALARGFEQQVVGDPLAAETTVGPLARADLRDTLAVQLRESLEAGAGLAAEVSGGTPEGFFHPACVLVDVAADSPARRQELFGPVAPVIGFDDEDAAVAIANETRYGLGASVWTGDAARAERLAGRIEAGSVFVNGMVKSDPRLPFGGIKDSGFGRELGREGILEFVNVQTIWIR